MIRKIMLTVSLVLALMGCAQEPKKETLESNFNGYKCNIELVNDVKKTLKAKAGNVELFKNLETGERDVYGLTKEMADQVEEGCMKGPYYAVEVK